MVAYPNISEITSEFSQAKVVEKPVAEG